VRMTGHVLHRLFSLTYNNWSTRVINYSRIIQRPTAVPSPYSTSSVTSPQNQKHGSHGTWGSKKVKPKVKVHSNPWITMANSAAVEEILAPLRASVKEQVTNT